MVIDENIIAIVGDDEIYYLEDNKIVFNKNEMVYSKLDLEENGFMLINHRYYTRKNITPQTRSIKILNPELNNFFVGIGDVVYSIGNTHLFILNVPENMINYFSRPYQFWVLEHGEDFIFDNTIDNFKLIDELC